MIERFFNKIWYKQTILFYICFPILAFFSFIYFLVTKLRYHLYFTFKFFKIYKAKAPVIVIGNLSTGGNGKTPVVIWLVNLLKKNGYKPGVISRGYGGHSQNYPVLVDDSMLPNETGDEPIEIFNRTGCKVSVSPDRVQSIKQLLDCGCDIIISDDGLQHYKFHHDIEVLVIDAKRRFGNEYLLPLGPLRENISKSKSVDLVVYNGQTNDEYNFSMDLVPSEIVNIKTRKKIDFKNLHNVIAIAAIGNPERFFDTVEGIGIDILKKVSYPDHYKFSKNDFKGLLEKNQNLLMTEKDAVKCKHICNSDNWWSLKVDPILDVRAEQKILERIEGLKI
ncbi:tetraacyldisaccharide 4'-kinase [Paraphotobacterium marinum]|uniref:Tetraacyldisaccharide 4'-kinase n=1 Tax=Paraphotobacterium marinum TaxID=1755811 RepID=A0A220VEC5_9GAMM|nr:tetraacyldisaccharide 4'-kinase [Paraphotobacterium marinum]ASK78641.1 tetraacyldisaccharide 4'-kinase [Paraphotobacterium marinum]